jgi:hypothetical protein
VRVDTQKPRDKEVLGLIAGGGVFPLMVADAARGKGLRVVAVAHEGETDPLLAEKVDEIAWIKLGQLGHLIRVLKKAGVTKTVMAGTINKKKMFENVRPDLRGLTLVSKLAIFHDDDILRAVARGNLTRRKPNPSEREDVEFGWKIAKELGRLDIGQCVVVRKKTVLAMEAIEGTSETILRGGRLAKEKAVVVKVSKPNQDLRFDVPAVGPDTIQVMAQVKASVLAIEAGKTLLFDKPAMISYADRSGIVIVSL